MSKTSHVPLGTYVFVECICALDELLEIRRGAQIDNLAQTSLHCKPYLGMRDRGQIKYIRRVSHAAKTGGSRPSSHVAIVACTTYPRIRRNKDGTS